MSLVASTLTRSVRSAAATTARATSTLSTRNLLGNSHLNSALRIAQHHRTLAMSSSSAAPYKVTSTPDAPSAIGPYVQATVHNGIIYCSGCIPLEPKTMTLVEGGIEAQAQRALDNLFAVVEASGGDKSTILKTTVFLADMADFAKVNVIYEKNFAPYKPARSAVAVRELPKSVGFEIEAIAAVKA